MNQPQDRRRVIGWCLAIVAQFAFLGWMVGAQERALANGERVVLAVAPVDPFDPLAGRYLAIRVDLARLDPAQVEVVAGDELAARPGDDALGRWFGQDAALELAPDGSPRAARRLRIGSAAAQARPPFLAGRVLWSSDGMLHLDLGIDRYYVPGDAEDPTLWWNRQTTRPTLTLAVRLTADGTSAVEELLVDGVPYPEWNRAQRAK